MCIFSSYYIYIMELTVSAAVIFVEILLPALISVL